MVWGSWGLLGGSWGRPGGHLGPKVRKSEKTVVRLTPNRAPLGVLILELFFVFFVRCISEEAPGHNFS